MAKALFLVLKKALFLELLAVQNLTPGFCWRTWSWNIDMEPNIIESFGGKIKLWQSCYSKENDMPRIKMADQKQYLEILVNHYFAWSSLYSPWLHCQEALSSIIPRPIWNNYMMILPIAVHYNLPRSALYSTMVALKSYLSAQSLHWLLFWRFIYPSTPIETFLGIL